MTTPEQQLHRIRAAADYLRLPCGCEIGTYEDGGESFFGIVPHSLFCKYYRYALEESRRQKKPVIKRDL
jgi:hypothetical protein